MPVFNDTANRVNLAFWSLLEAVGFALKASGLLALLGGFILISEQALTFMQTEVWQPKSLLLAIPDSLLTWIVGVGDLAGVSGQIVGFLAWMPLSAAVLVSGVCVYLVGRLLARDR